MAGGSSKGPRYAPEDPTLPKPWRELIDGASGYHYYWNPETNVTQYERPVKESLPPPPPGPPPGVAVSSSVRSQHRDDGRRSGAAARSRSHQRAGTKGHGAAPPPDDGGGLTGDAYCRHHEITVTGDEAPAPFTTFESTSFPMEILKEVHHAGFSAPTPIQAQSWPIALKGFDIVAVAKTGSGKTLGYLLPGFIHLKNRRNNPKVGPTVLVLAPTRELATQIQDEAEKFGRTSRIASTCLYGGAPKGPQLRDLDRGVDIVVATPGRLNDILEMRKISLRQVSYLVLDEADRMLDMGFEPQIRKIVEQIPERRQTLMFTATWPKEVRNISKDLLVHPIQVNIGGTDELVANKAITQFVEVLSPNEKQKRVEQILRSQEPNAKVLIFCSTKKMCDQLTRTLDRRFGAVAIHGDKSQGERDRVLSHFRTGRSPILVATDVASRGLDIKDIRVVINYDFPTDIEDYVHRIGRTGRAGATGVSYTFFCDKDSKYALDLAKVLEGASQHVPPELRDLARRGKRGGGGKRRWRSSPNRGRDSSYGGRGGRGLSQSGRSDAYRGGRGYSDDELPKRYDHGLHGTKGNATSVNHKARGRSPSRSCSSSLSPSPKRRRVELGNGRRDSKSWDHNRGSRSRSISQGLDGGAGPDHSQSPPSKRVVPSNDHHLTSNPAQSPIPNYDQQPLQQKSPQSFDNGSTKDAEISRTLSPMKEKSQSPCNSMDNGKHVGANSPTQWNQKNSPNCHDETIEVEGKGPVPSPRRIHKHGEEEEGMILADDDGSNLPEVVRSSPDRPYQVSGLNVETAE